MGSGGFHEAMHADRRCGAETLAHSEIKPRCQPYEDDMSEISDDIMAISDDIESSVQPAQTVSIEAMRASPRCGAKTRDGTPCEAPAMSGKKRCRMHGGAPGSGAPLGNQNARKHGEYSKRAKDEIRRIHELTRRALQMLKEI